MLTHCSMLDAVDPCKGCCRRLARASLHARSSRARRAPARAAALPSSHPLRRQGRERRLRVAALVEQLSEDELMVAIDERDKPLIVDFYATWCGPCLLLAKELEEVATKLGERVRVVKVDVDDNPAIASQLQIQGLPTMVFVGTDRKKPALRIEGLQPASTIINIIDDINNLQEVQPQPPPES